VIHAIASFSEANFPKWCTAPLGHAIRTRQTRSFCTGDKAVALRTGKPAYSAGLSFRRDGAIVCKRLVFKQTLSAFCEHKPVN
jgi:hypothetical protein